MLSLQGMMWTIALGTHTEHIVYSTRLYNWRYSLIFLTFSILVLIPQCMSLLLVVGVQWSEGMSPRISEVGQFTILRARSWSISWHPHIDQLYTCRCLSVCLGSYSVARWPDIP